MALAIVSAENELIAPPTWSADFALIADKQASFVLYPETIQQLRAGTTLQYHVETRDRFHNATPLPPIVWSVIGIPTQTGSIVDGSFQAHHTGASKIVATSGSAADTSSLVYVLPGVFSSLKLTGGRDSVVAGQRWSDGNDDLTVTAYDVFENVSSDFDGEVYFRSSDTLAEAPFTVAAPYRFVPADQGRHLFRGSGFRLLTAGRQSLDLMMGDTVEQSLNSILVLPAAPSSYQVAVPDTVTAGQQFSVNISGAEDPYGNSVSGLVTVGLEGGSGVAPSGALPSLPSLFVTSGSGSGSCVLVKTGVESLRFVLDGATQSRTVVVIAGSLGRFDFALDAAQPPGRAFVGTARLSAFDAFDNVVSQFNAATDPVTISCSGSGTVLKNRISADSAFADGVCDLTRIGTGYSGSDLYVTFTATSQSGKKGTSPVVGFSSLKIKGGNLAEDTMYVGEQYTFRLTIWDFGSQSGIIDSVRLYLGGAAVTTVSVDKAFPNTLVALSESVYTFVGNVPDRPGESLEFAAKFNGRIGNTVVSDSVGNLARLTVLSQEGVGVVAGSLSPLQVTRDREYAFSLKVRNNSGDDLHLTDSTELLLGPTSSAFRYRLENPTVVAGHGGVSELKFVNGLIPATAPDQISDIHLQLVGTLGAVGFDQTFAVTSPIVTQSAPALEYQEASLTPTTVFRGKNAVFAMDVENTGMATLVVDLSASEFTLYAANRRLATPIDEVQLQIPGGVTNLTFKPVFVPVDFPTTLDSIGLQISGTSNGHSESAHIKLAGNAVSIPAGAAVQLVATQIETRNAPYVNVGQSFSFNATIRNQGDEPLTQIIVKLQSDGESLFNDSLLLASLPVAAESTLTFAVTAAMAPKASELFSARVIAATGVNSGLSAQILQAVNSTQAVVIQTPANLQLVSAIASPPDAQDGVVGLSSTFTLSANVINHGQADVGAGEVSLRRDRRRLCPSRAVNPDI